MLRNESVEFYESAVSSDWRKQWSAGFKCKLCGEQYQRYWQLGFFNCELEESRRLGREEIQNESVRHFMEGAHGATQRI